MKMIAWACFALLSAVGALTIVKHLFDLAIRTLEDRRWRRDARAHDELIRARFPMVRTLARGRPPCGTIMAFMVPDDRVREFMRFVLNELPVMLEGSGFKFHGVMPFSESSTRTYYNDLWLQFKNEPRSDEWT